MKEDKRGTPAIYFNSLNRSFNVFGVEKQLFFLILGLSVPIALSSGLNNLMMDVIAIVTFLVLYSVGVLITRIDNRMFAVYKRHMRYKKYYTATAGIHSKPPVIQLSVPFYEGQRGLV